MTKRKRNWLGLINGVEVVASWRRETAMNVVRKMKRWRPGAGLVAHRNTGERWDLRRGSWFKQKRETV